ncbi:helix-turn-helix domain-containing protein [Knoellia sp. CPCC 206450]|uniref:helix-turn-helix domain-containing protein n=1 Tax=Knoellia tibetensis TaxID=3404798 RepID=UPI003B4376CC
MTTLTRPPVSVSQAAELLCVHRRTVLRMINAGRLEAVKLGENTAGWAIDPDSIDDLLGPDPEQEAGA